MPQPETPDLRSQDIAADRRQELVRLFPEIRTEGGQLDFERLKLALGEAVDVGKERFGMHWPGKAECFKVIQAPSLGTLLPCREESVEFDTTENLILEGDNLEVLKLLQKSYLGKVKMIYIDPPYNTGSDFIYPDNYAESLQNYLQYTGQADAAGTRFGTNTEADGRFHSKWLNMVYPRLYLARNLLADDGVLFVSIDDREVANLRAACNEVFGEENFIANVVWQKKYTRSNDAKYFSDNHDHILVFARYKDGLTLNLQERTEEQTAAYSNPDNHPKGPWKATPLHAKSGSPGGFQFTFKNGVTWSPPPGTFPRFSDSTLAVLDGANEIWFGADGKATPSRKTFLTEAKPGVTPITIWPCDEVGHNHEANNELKALGLAGVFDNPKPTRLVRRMLELSTTASDGHLILDFFSGSGTTAHAVLDLNHQDAGNRKFILVQLPEPTHRGGYRTIADIAKQRVRRVIEKLKSEPLGQLAPDGKGRQDRGFRVFKLSESNFTTWDTGMQHDVTVLERQLELQVDRVRGGRTAEDILYELVLKSGFPLTTPIEKMTLPQAPGSPRPGPPTSCRPWVHGARRQAGEGKVVYRVAGGALVICLEREITLDLVLAIAEKKPERVVCLDEGFAGNDQLKANAVQIFKTRGIAGFKTV